MPKTHVVAGLCLLLCVAGVSRAQDAKPESKPDPKVELMKLYKTAGTSWSYRTVTWDREGGAESSSESWRVEKIDDNRATVTHSGRNLRGNSSWSGTEHRAIDKPWPDDVAFADTALPEETLDLGFAKFPCKKHSKIEDGEQVTHWVSTEHHPLVVKRVKLTPNSSEIRKLTSFQTSEVDVWLLYRMPGRSWTMKSSMTQGEHMHVSGYRQTVKSVDGMNATVTMEVLDKDLKAFPGMAPTEYKMEMRSAEPARNPQPQPVVASKNETIKVEAGEFACTVTEIGKTKTWMSTTWAGLMVRMEAENMVSELVAFDLGHDEGRFLRSAGNSATLRSATEVAGMKIATISRRTVSAVTEGKATVININMDQNGREVGRSETSETVAEKASPLLAYSGQKEETIVTPAGTFVALVTELAPGQKTWTHHGVVVRQEMKTDDYSIIIEATELKLE